MAYAQNGSDRIYFEVEGDGPGLLLHHGFAMSLQRWREAGYVEALKSTYRVVLMDARGHGRSDKPHDPARYTTDLILGDVKAVLREAGLDEVHFWGYSMGGAVARGVAVRSPEMLRSLILGGSAPSGPAPAQPGPNPLAALLAQGMEAWVQAMEARWEPFVPAARAAFLANDAEALRAWSLAAATTDDILPTIPVPCLAYAGEADPVYPRVAAFAAAASVEFFPVPGCSHPSAFARSDLVLPRVMEFLERVEAAPAE